MQNELSAVDELQGLIHLFYKSPDSLATFEMVAPSECPPNYAQLLAHQSHMTVTVEKRHACEVDVSVLRSTKSQTHYCREILLRRQSDGRVVQHGIVRLNLEALQKQVRNEIMAQQLPLGRVLINHNVLRQVQLNSLWKVSCRPRLAELFDLPVAPEASGDDAKPGVTFGRTALIYTNGEPGVELLEIIAPEESF